MGFFASIASAARKGISKIIDNPTTIERYILSITSPLEDAIFSEGQVVSINASATELPDASNPINWEATDILHFISYGQSLSSGTDSQPLLSVQNVGGNVSIQEEWMVFDHTTPTGLNTMFPLEFDGSTTKTYVADPSEAPVLGWANSFKTGLAREVPTHPLNNSVVMASVAGKGGINIGGLMKGTIYYDQWKYALQAGKDAADLAGKTITCPAMLFMQGESEPSTETFDTYLANILQLFSDMRNDAALIYGQTELPVMFVYQPEQAPGFVKRVYEHLIKTYNWIVGVGNVYYLPDVTIHLDPNGSRWIGEQYGKATVKMIRDNQKFQPLIIIKTEVIGNKVILTFNRDIIIDERPKGWAGNVPTIQGISSTYTIAGNTMTLTTNVNDLTTQGDLYLNCISSKIRDTDDYLATTLYSDYVRIKANGNDFKDEAGNIIYGQPYPLWNWLYDYSGYKIQ